MCYFEKMFFLPPNTIKIILLIFFVLLFFDHSQAQEVAPSITVENYSHFLTSIPDADQYYDSAAMQDQIQRIENGNQISYHILEGQEDQPIFGLTDIDIERYWLWRKALPMTSSPLMMFFDSSEHTEIERKTHENHEQARQRALTDDHDSNTDPKEKETCADDPSVSSISHMDEMSTSVILWHPPLDLSKLHPPHADIASNSKRATLGTIPIASLPPTAVRFEVHQVPTIAPRNKHISFHPEILPASEKKPMVSEEQIEHLTEYSLQFARLRMDLKKKLKPLSKEDPKKSDKVASLYNAAYLKAKDCIQNTLTLIPQHISFLEQEENMPSLISVAKFLAESTIKAIHMASQVVPPNKIRPIKEERPLFKMPIKPIQVPNEWVENKDVSADDMNDLLTVKISNDAIENLQDMRNLFKCPSETLGTSLHEAQIERAHRAWQIAFINAENASNLRSRYRLAPKLFYDDELANRLKSESESSFAHMKDCSVKVDVLRSSNPIEDVLIAKKEAITDLLALIKSGLETADRLIEMLQSRRIIDADLLKTNQK